MRVTSTIQSSRWSDETGPRSSPSTARRSCSTRSTGFWLTPNRTASWRYVKLERKYITAISHRSGNDGSMVDLDPCWDAVSTTCERAPKMHTRQPGEFIELGGT